MAEALARLEHVDDVPVVLEVHRAGDDHEQRARRLGVLDERRTARLELAIERRLGDRPQVALGQPVERRLDGEELGDGAGIGQGSTTR
jgi:hypothetical protein